MCIVIHIHKYIVDNVLSFTCTRSLRLCVLSFTCTRSLRLCVLSFTRTRSLRMYCHSHAQGVWEYVYCHSHTQVVWDYMYCHSHTQGVWDYMYCHSDTQTVWECIVIHIHKEFENVLSFTYTRSLRLTRLPCRPVHPEFGQPQHTPWPSHRTSRVGPECADCPSARLMTSLCTYTYVHTCMYDIHTYTHTHKQEPNTHTNTNIHTYTCIYRIAGKLGEGFNLAIWRICGKLPN